MSFNSDPSKQAQEVIFSQKIKRSSVNFPVLIFNNNQVLQTPYQKFGEHLRYIANKVNPLGYYVNFKNVYWDDH